jgi:DNA-directed RNA polymerase specialized sigma24 family protein
VLLRADFFGPVVARTRFFPGIEDVLMNCDEEFAELLNRVKAGDKLAGETLCREFPEMVRQMLLADLAGTDLQASISVREVIQSTLKDVFAKIEVVASANTPTSYLRRMAKNKLIERIRKLCGRDPDSRPATEVGVALEMVPSSDEGVSEAARKRDFFDQVMAGLSDEERILMEAYLNGESWLTAGILLGITENAARKRFRPLLERLRKEFRPSD